MNHWTAEELTFRCDRLSIRLERLAQNFLRIASLCLNEAMLKLYLRSFEKVKCFWNSRRSIWMWTVRLNWRKCNVNYLNGTFIG